MKAMILAAGLGTRLRPLTDNVPKPLLKLGGSPLLHRIICKLEAAGCEAVMINTHHLSTQIESFLRRQHYNLPVFTRHEAILLETGGGIKNVSDFWDKEPFIVINGDIYTDMDLKAVYHFHRSCDHPVTMVLHDWEAFNNVWVTRENQIVGFGKKAPCPPRKQNGRPPVSYQSGPSDYKLLAYTGIQVMDPLVLDFIPENQPSSIIDTYCGMIRSGLTINGYIVKPRYWHDIGTMAGYRKASREALARRTFAENLDGGEDEVVTHAHLQGDGSDRRWYRFSSATASTVIVDHGPPEKDVICEADAYCAIGNHLRNKGVPVPHIYGYDASLGLVSMEDLGDRHLQAFVHDTGSRQDILRHYRRLIDLLVVMGVDGAQGFDTGWTFQTTHYDEAFILEKECRYFTSAFLNGYRGIDIPFTALRKECEPLAAGASNGEYMGFLHRDFQSRNILVHKGEFRFIDFQGGRLGPLQYDLASLLIDPYVVLPEDMQDVLFDHYIERLSERIPVEKADFERGYRYCRITRNLQALGAFAFLSRSKGKPGFEKYIPAAVQSLKRNIKKIDLPVQSILRQIIDNL